MKILLIIFSLLYSLSSFGQLVNGDDLKKQKYYDSTLNGMRLRDPRSVEKVLATTDDLVDHEDMSTEVLSGNGSQLLTMVFLPGDAVNQFSQFKVENNSAQVKSKCKVNDKEFVTGKGIKLGIREDDLVKILGEPAETRDDNGSLLYSYQQEDGVYFGYYWFRAGKLVKFWFGEEYP